MEISEYKNIFLNEESHFFYISTHYLVLELIKKYASNKKLLILDAGCGTGELMRKLANFGEIIGIDSSEEAIKYAKKRLVDARLASIQEMPFKNSSFDMVTNIDVIYHMNVDDAAALSEVRRVLKPNGILVLRVPANKYLISAHDAHVHTARRYSKKELEHKLHETGFEIKLISYVHSPIFPVSLIKVMLEKITKKNMSSAIGVINKGLNSLLIIVLKIEASLISLGLTMPFGQGLIVVAVPSRRSGH